MADEVTVIVRAIPGPPGPRGLKGERGERGPRGAGDPAAARNVDLDLAYMRTALGQRWT